MNKDDFLRDISKAQDERKKIDDGQYDVKPNLGQSKYQSSDSNQDDGDEYVDMKEVLKGISRKSQAGSKVRGSDRIQNRTGSTTRANKIYSNMNANQKIDEDTPTTGAEESTEQKLSRDTMVRKAKLTSPKSGITGLQFVAQLNALERQVSETSISEAVIEATTSEIINLVKRGALIKSRYMSKVLDLASSNQYYINSDHLNELSDLRRSYEEIEQGIEVIKENISNGNLKIIGID